MTGVIFDGTWVSTVRLLDSHHQPPNAHCDDKLFVGMWF